MIIGFKFTIIWLFQLLFKSHYFFWNLNIIVYHREGGDYIIIIRLLSMCIVFTHSCVLPHWPQTTCCRSLLHSFTILLAHRRNYFGYFEYNWLLRRFTLNYKHKCYHFVCLTKYNSLFILHLRKFIATTLQNKPRVVLSWVKTPAHHITH